MQNGVSPAEYKRLKAQFDALKAQRKRDADKPPPPPPTQQRISPAQQQQEASFTVTQGLLIAFLTLILYEYLMVYGKQC